VHKIVSYSHIAFNARNAENLITFYCDKLGIEKDLIGRVYEYFLKEFAVNATKEKGEYYKPHDVVQLMRQ